MGYSSSIPLPRFSPSLPPPIRIRSTAKASSFPSPIPRTKRKNHLRLNLPKTQIPKPHSPPLSLPPPPPPAADVSVLEVSDSVEAALQDAVQASEGVDPFPPSAHHSWSLKPALGISLGFAALFFVRAMASVLLLDIGGVERTTNGGDRTVGESESEGKRQIGVSSEFEKKVLEIRAMAKEARASEVKVIADEESRSSRRPLLENVGRKRNGEKSNPKRIGLFGSNSKARKAPEGFRGRKDRDECIHGGLGGIQEIDGQNSAKEPVKLREQRTENSMQSKIISGIPLVKNDSVQIAAQSENSTVNQGSSMISGNINGRSDSSSQIIKKRQSMTVIRKEKDDQYGTGNGSWWLKLPYVLAIFLHRGADRTGTKGLYSLKMKNSSGDDSCSPSYAVVFQDRGDATNFCYILESFFEELGDFNADIVPMTIQELDEAVKTDESRMIIVRKGQLKLYAGQPLTEVETVLRSFVN